MSREYPLRALPKEQGEQDTLKIESNSESDRENKNESEKETESVNNKFSFSAHIHNILGRKLDFREERASVSLFIRNIHQQSLFCYLLCVVCF